MTHWIRLLCGLAIAAALTAPALAAGAAASEPATWPLEGWRVRTLELPVGEGRGALAGLSREANEASGLPAAWPRQRIAAVPGGGFVIKDPVSQSLKRYDDSGRFLGEHRHERAAADLFGSSPFVVAGRARAILQTPRELLFFGFATNAVEPLFEPESRGTQLRRFRVTGNDVWAGLSTRGARAGEREERLVLLDASGKQKAVCEGVRASGFAVAPDGTLFAIAQEAPPASLIVADGATGQPLLRRELAGGSPQGELLAALSWETGVVDVFASVGGTPGSAELFDVTERKLRVRLHRIRPAPAAADVSVSSAGSFYVLGWPDERRALVRIYER